MKNQCQCGYGFRRNPKRRFAPGHSKFTRPEKDLKPGLVQGTSYHKQFIKKNPRSI
jgi:hypothetical protein